MTNRSSQFDDPEMDTLLRIVLSLGGEIYILRDRLRIIEKMLAEKGVVSIADIEGYKPTPEEDKQISEDRDAFMARVFRDLEDNRN